MGFVMKKGKTALDQEQADGEQGAPDVTAVGAAASIRVEVGYPYASDGDTCRVAYYPRGSEAPVQPFRDPAPLGEAVIRLSAEHRAATTSFEDVPAGAYDVYYHLRASRGDATEWTNLGPDRLEDAPAPLPVEVGGVAQSGAADTGGILGSLFGGDDASGDGSAGSVTFGV